MISFHLDGLPISYEGDPSRTLLSWLREDRGIVSVKDGCSGQGFCRACTVEIDGRARLACLTRMSKLEGSVVTTLEGLPAETRQILADAFVRHGAVQCGFCSPGFLARTRLLLEKNRHPTREEVVEALRHHFCRCTGYEAIVDAVLDAASSIRDPHYAAEPSAGGGVGHAQPKYRAHAKALGMDPFVDDLRVEGMLFGALCFSEHPRARIQSIDSSTADNMPGVLRVILAKDIPGERLTGLVRRDWPLLVAEKDTTRCVGDVLALIVADTEKQARAAATSMEVEYEVLEPIATPFEALTSSVHLHDGGNLLSKTVVKRGGGVDEALSRSAYVARCTFETQRVEHAFLEVEAALALPWKLSKGTRKKTEGAAEHGTCDALDAENPMGVEIYSSTQGAYVDREQIAALLALPKSAVKVTQVAAGGAFGGKEDLSVQGHAALAASLLGRPVKVKLDRAESIRMHPKRHPMHMEYEVGCDEGGRLRALKARLVGDTGAYASVGAKIIERAAGHAAGAYQVPCVDVIARAVYTNNVPSGAMRGFGVNQVTFAMESCLDELCEQGGFDRWELRYRNAMVDGGMTTTGQVVEAGVGLRATLLAVKEAYERTPNAGLACGMKNCGVGNGRSDSCEVEIEIASSQRVVIKHGWTEMGQGVHTIALQVLAESTGIDPEIIDVVVCTEHEAAAGMTTSSRGTSLLGNALIVAAGDLKRDLDEGGGALSRLTGRRYRGRWSFDASTPVDSEGEIVTHYSYGYATQLVILGDDGQIERVIAAHDAGRVMNPALFRGQVVGSVHMGLGYALSENLPQRASQMPPTRLKDLGLLRMDRMPPVEVIAVEVADPLGPYGAKGVGEIGLVPTAAAVASAYRAYDGRPRRKLPIQP